MVYSHCDGVNRLAFDPQGKKKVSRTKNLILGRRLKVNDENMTVSTDCTVGQHFVLVVPDCVLEPILAPFAHPCEGSNVSCSLEKLTSDPDIYIVPLDGCGVSKHVRHLCVSHNVLKATVMN